MYESQDQVKRYVFRSRRNLSGPTAGSRRLSGSGFQTVGPATAKARAPSNSPNGLCDDDNDDASVEATPHPAAPAEGNREDQILSRPSWFTDDYTKRLRRTSLRNFTIRLTMRPVGISALLRHHRLFPIHPFSNMGDQAFPVAASRLWNTAAESHVGAVTDCFKERFHYSFP